MTLDLIAVGDNCLDVYLSKGHMAVGGNALNVAVQWRRLGLAARYLGVVGKDAEGDIILAARSASFIQVFSRIGLVPDLGSTWLLPRLIGRQRALDLMLLNEPLSAERAKEWGLVREVVDDAKLLDEAKVLAGRLADGPTRALVATRQLLEESEHASYAEQFRREIELQSIIRESADAQEGRKAFVEKRKAQFTGR